MLVAVTPTGGRPEAFAKCIEYMESQTISEPVRWVVVDDGTDPMPTPEVDGWATVHIRPRPLWEPGQNTQARNLLAGLDYVEPGDKLAIIEDDDQYAPDWLERVSGWLDRDDLVGEAPSLYRHLNGNEKWMNNKRHASLCATAMKGRSIDRFREILEEGGTMIDCRLWKMGGKIHPWDGGVIGIKGYPGRPGIGVGHRI